MKDGDMIFSLKREPDVFIQSVYKKAMKDLRDFFELDWQEYCPRIFLIPDRKTYDAVLGFKTEKWMIGQAEQRAVFLLAQERFEKESNHVFSKEKYKKLIYHELCHCFSRQCAGGNFFPKWVNEGISLYVSGQIHDKQKPEKFRNFLEFYDKSGEKVYLESGFAVEILVEKFGKKKFLSLLKSLSNIKTERKFKTRFKDIYKCHPTYKFFNQIYKP